MFLSPAMALPKLDSVKAKGSIATELSVHIITNFVLNSLISVES
jgi:hypothetical protein